MEHQYGDGDVLNKTKKSIAFIRFRKKKKLFFQSLTFHSECFTEKFEMELPLKVSLVQHGFKSLNQFQEAAVKEALSKPFTLIQGPPG